MHLVPILPSPSPPSLLPTRPSPVLSRPLLQHPHRQRFSMRRALLPCQRFRCPPRILNRLHLVPRHGMHQRRPPQRRPDVHPEPFLVVELHEFLAKRCVYLLFAADHVPQLVLDYPDALHPHIRGGDLCRREATVRTGALEAPVSEAALALVPREVAINVGDGQFLAGVDVADGRGDVGDVVEAVADAFQLSAWRSCGVRVKGGEGHTWAGSRG